MGACVGALAAVGVAGHLGESDAGRALLVAGRDVADAGVIAQRVEDVHRLLAGHAEDVFAALRGEAVDEEMRGGPGAGFRLGGHGGERSRVRSRGPSAAGLSAA